MLSEVLRSLSSSLQTPVIVVLLLLAAAALFMLGSLVAEAFTERSRLRARLPALADALRENGATEDIIEGSGLLRRQKLALLEVTRHPSLTPSMRESLAARVVAAER